MEEPAAEYLEADIFLNDEALELTEAAAEAFAARVPAHAPATRQFTNTSKEKLLKRLQADPELVTAEGYKQFGYSGPGKLKGDERLIEREYWLKSHESMATGVMSAGRESEAGAAAEHGSDAAGWMHPASALVDKLTEDEVEEAEGAGGPAGNAARPEPSDAAGQHATVEVPAADVLVRGRGSIEDMLKALHDIAHTCGHEAQNPSPRTHAQSNELKALVTRVRCETATV